MDTGKNTNNLSKYSETQRNEALRRYKLIESFLCKKEALAVICSRHKLALRTARRWIADYKKQGLEGLIRQKRNDIAKRRSISNEIQQIAEGIYLQNAHLSISSIYRKVKEYATGQDQKCPSYRTICNLIKKLPTPMVTLAHHGDKAYKQKYDILYRHQADYANQVWQADHVLLDIFIVIDDKQKSARPWLTVIIDDYSRAIAGYELSFLAPSAIKTSLCLRQSIWCKKESSWSICGIPNVLYTDHGSDFTSNHIRPLA
ncbi:helix-turn-helix domain-containing protein [Candidatus Lariskella endosymbiont of Epinotia ramella]|uniref:helix-turn-helix domain-containing protein n=1 Tax=Candidatus Lariskella endosymbiont of Epinotia ramella TaxID=3066224 RepID=UPI0030CAE970